MCGFRRLVDCRKLAKSCFNNSAPRLKTALRHVSGCGKAVCNLCLRLETRSISFCLSCWSTIGALLRCKQLRLKYRVEQQPRIKFYEDAGSWREPRGSA